MIDTKNFATKTIFDPRESITAEGFFPIAIDIGYSSVNLCSPVGIWSFPAFAKKLERGNDLVGTPDKDEILYKDMQGNVWRVGAAAQKTLSSFDTNDSINELYGRNRYGTPIFRVLVETAIGLALVANGAPLDCPVCIQTGLPPAYIDEDSPMLKEVFSGDHEFFLKVGEQPFKKVRTTIEAGNVFVMSQPKGTLISVSVDNNGVPTKDAVHLINGNVIVFDGGFGTLDTFRLKNRQIDAAETFSNFGMKAVLERFAEKIKEKYNTTVRVPSIQPVLESGVVEVRVPREDNKLRFKTSLEPVGDLLEEASREICEEAIDKLMTIYNYLNGINYLIVTGGTGAAWKEYIEEAFADDPTVNVIMGNANDPTLDIIFANTRGYYMTLINTLRKRKK